MRSFLRTLSEFIDDVWFLDWPWRGLVVGGVAVVVFLLIVAWRVMIPVLLLAGSVALYLHYSRPKDSL